MPYVSAEDRYTTSTYVRSGKSGLLLPAISLGLWQNFGDTYSFANGRSVVLRSFDLGITHFDLANNYGPPPGSAETNFGRILHDDLAPYRDELIVSTKAGYTMWEGPYGDWGSRKYLVASLDQSLKRMGLDYVDIFYHHRPDPNTPVEETLSALDHIVRSGKALYAGISNYNPEQTKAAAAIARTLGTPLTIHQPKYSMINRDVEGGLLKTLAEEAIGCIVFSPLAQGLLTNRYLTGTPSDSRVGQKSMFLNEAAINEKNVGRAQKLNDIAQSRGQSLAQMAVTWIRRNPEITSVLIGASKTSQVEELVTGLTAPLLSSEELGQIEEILAEYK